MASNAVFKRQMYEAIEFLCNIPCGSNQTHRDSIPQEDSINGIGLSPQNEEFYYGENRVNNRMTIRLPGPTNYVTLLSFFSFLFLSKARSQKIAIIVFI